jgi:hypothetical protein
MVYIQGILKGGSITVPLTSYLTGLDECVLQIKTEIVSCHTADSKPVKQEVNGTVILPPLVFPGIYISVCVRLVSRLLVKSNFAYTYSVCTLGTERGQMSFYQMTFD